MLDADAAAELLGEFAACEMGRALLMTTTISSPTIPEEMETGTCVNDVSGGICRAGILTDGGHSLGTLCFQHIDAFRYQTARVIDDLSDTAQGLCMNNGLVFRENCRARWGTAILLTFIRPLSPIILPERWSLSVLLE